MKSLSLNNIGLTLILVVFGFISIYFLSDRLENSRPTLPENYVDEDLAVQGSKLKGFTLGFDGLIADWYWMQSLQYVGKKLVDSKEGLRIDSLKKLNPRLLYPYLDNASTLDPQFDAVYSYGAVVLPDIDPNQAIKIAQKGIDNNPENWRLYQHLGFIYWKLERYDNAAETYQKGSEIQNAPLFMKQMAAKMLSDAGSRETSREIYGQMFKESADPQTKEIAELHLLQLDALDEIDAINAVLKIVKEKNGSCPQSLNQILPLLKTIKLPENKDFHINQHNKLVDPLGTPYLFKAEKCEISLDEMNSKIPPQIKASE